MTLIALAATGRARLPGGDLAGTDAAGPLEANSHPRAHRSTGMRPTSGLADALIERTSQVAERAVSASENPLNELAWMVGDWIDADEHATIESSVKWSKNDAFLIRSFRVSNLAAEPLSGMQVIAWDPAEKRIRSWTYDSRGGFGEESWSRSGDHWSMRTKFTRPDGSRASAVHVMTRASDDSFRWKSVSRVIDGSLQPDIDEVTVVRKSTESNATAHRMPLSHKPRARRTERISHEEDDQNRDFRRLGAARFVALEQCLGTEARRRGVAHARPASARPARARTSTAAPR